MREAQSFGPGRDSDAARLIDDDADRLAFSLLRGSNLVNLLLVVIQDERDLPVRVPVPDLERGEKDFCFS